jgi:hypothetical protein
VLVEILEPEHIIFILLSGPLFKMTIPIVDEGGKTSAPWRMTFESITECDRVRNFVTLANQENFDRLEEELIKMAWELYRLVFFLLTPLWLTELLQQPAAIDHFFDQIQW